MRHLLRQESMIAPFAETVRILAFVTVMFGSGLSLAASQQPEDSTDAEARIEVRIENRKVVGDQIIRVTQGQLVEMIWTTDEAAELHIHGYDIRFEISPDTPAEVSFTAHATGRFAVTSHGFGGQHGHGHDTLVYIEVYPK
jgi:hypothetical protein